MRIANLLMAGTILLLAACASQTQNGQNGPAVAVDADGGKGALITDGQERDMREAVASSDAATVQREGNLLAVVLNADASFSGDDAAIEQDLYPELSRIAQVLRQYPRTLVRVEGHTDNVGTDAYNMDISYRRALAVGNFLAESGVEAGRVQVMAFGRAQPVASNDTEAGRQMNRRVEIKIAPFPE